MPPLSPFLQFTSHSRSGGFDAPGGEGLRLYCFAHAGGSSAQFASWARTLSPQIMVLGVESPGHGSRIVEQPLRAVEQIAAHTADAIAAGGSRTPFAFYGHSLGALVAYETARLLPLDYRSRLVHLFVGAARAPHFPPVTPLIRHLDDPQFLEAVQTRYGGFPAEVLNEPELVAMMLPILRADFTAYETYQHVHALLECPVTAFYGRRDPLVHASAVDEWATVTSGPFTLEAVEGAHFFLSTSRELVLGRIQDKLAALGQREAEIMTAQKR